MSSLFNVSVTSTKSVLTIDASLKPLEVRINVVFVLLIKLKLTLDEIAHGVEKKIRRDLMSDSIE